MRADDGRDSRGSALERVGHLAGRAAGGLALALLWLHALMSALLDRSGTR